MAQVSLRQGFDALDHAVQAHLGFDMSSGAMMGDIEQHLFIAPGRYPGHGPYLGVTHFADAKSVQDFRQ